MSNPNWGELVTATLAHRRKAIADTFTKNNALYYEMRRRGRDKTIPGGRTIATPLMIGEDNVNFQWYTGREGLNVAGMEVLDSAEYPWKQYACGVSISGIEMLMNSGPAQVMDMMKVRVQHAEKTINNEMHRSAYGDGTAHGGKEFGGMGLLISETAGATVAGINSGVSTWWDNKRRAIGTAPTTTNIFNEMLQLYLETSRGTDKTDLIVADNTWYSVYVTSLQAQQRFMDGKLARAGFSNVLFQDSPVIPDGGMGGYAPEGMIYMNLDTIEIAMHDKRNNVVLGGPRRPLTEDSDTVIIAGMGNWICTNRMLNGRLTE